MGPSHSQEDAFAAPAGAGKQRYYFDVYVGEAFTKDDHGLELDGLESAQREAVRALPEIAKDALPDSTQRDFVIQVRDEAGQKVLRATLSLTVERLGTSPPSPLATEVAAQARRTASRD
jgi:hypothetical protein